MRIGRFAEINKLSIDTVRHYMDFGLIMPDKSGGQYTFDERCQRDLEDILYFKSMGFTLNEVKSIFVFRNLGKLTPYQENEYYKSFFINKHRNIEKTINELMAARKRLDVEISKLSQNTYKKNFSIGVDLRALNLLKCLSCCGDMLLKDGRISNNQIMDGVLKCDCGEEYHIEDGILNINDSYKNAGFEFHHDYISEYINMTDVEYLDNLCKGMEWIHKKINFEDFQNKILMELGSGVGFFLRNIYNNLPQNSLYIAVDHDMERHKFLKNIFEMSECRRNILFICTDFSQIPIKDEAVDALVDFSGTSNYSFHQDEFLLELVNSHLKDDAYLIGSYILFKNFSLDSMIEDKFRKNFILKNVKESITKLKYKAIAERTSGYLERGGKYENYFREGEKVYSYIFYGKR